MKSGRRRTRSGVDHPTGLTLVEVVAGLVLLAFLAATALTGLAMHQRQWRRAEERLSAVRAADRLVAYWYGSAGRPPRLAIGLCPEDPDWAWRTMVVAQALGPPAVETIRLELHRPAEPTTVACTLELLAPAVIAPIP